MMLRRRELSTSRRIAALVACAASFGLACGAAEDGTASDPAALGETAADTPAANASTASPGTASVSTVNASAASEPRDKSARIRERDGAEMRCVPAGAFVRGSPRNVGDDDEHPPSTIRVGDFWIDKFEVTVAQYRGCVAAQQCSEPTARVEAATHECNWDKPERGAHPINCVVWQEAADYCRFVGSALPTEAQWEKAARGTNGRLYPWGDEPASCDFTVMPSATGIAGCGARTTAPVGSKPRDVSPYGVFDMSGNVREWVADYYDEHFYAHAPPDDPSGPRSGWARALRGGSWEVHKHDHMRAANRYRLEPKFRFHGAGFRCAESAPAPCP